MERPLMIMQKNADKTRNRIIIPQKVIDKFGNSFYMEIYKEMIILKPIKTDEDE